MIRPQRKIRALVAALAACAMSASAADWTLVDLGTLGGPNAYATAVSAGGRVAGCSETAAGEIHAFVWYGGTMTDLGRGAEGAGNSCALALNDEGLVAGRASTGELVLWKEGVVTPLGFRGDVGDMNTHGVVVGARTVDASTRAFIYRDGVVTELGEPSARGEATAINTRGQVVGA